MPAQKPLGLHEEILLLALCDRTGKIVGSRTYYQFGVAGGILAELMLQQRIVLDGSKRNHVQLRDSQSTGDEILDECLERIGDARSATTLAGWVGRFAGLKLLKNRVAVQLCRRGILRHEEKSVLLLFKQEIYPEIDPKPEQEIRERLRRAIFTDSREVDPKTGILVALAESCGILPVIFGRKDLKARKERLAQLKSGDSFGQAAKSAVDEAIIAMNAMIHAMNASLFMMTTMMPSDAGST